LRGGGASHAGDQRQDEDRRRQRHAQLRDQQLAAGAMLQHHFVGAREQPRDGGGFGSRRAHRRTAFGQRLIIPAARADGAPLYTVGPRIRSFDMQYRRLGSSGLQLSALSLGAWLTFGAQISRGQARELVAAAWDHGINFFDNAETYADGEAERVMGDVIVDLRLPRDGFCVSSKVFFGSAKDARPTQRGLSRKHVHDACHAALKRLRVEHLDLYFCHRPDPDTPVEETVWAM